MDKINQEVITRRVIKFYMSLHANYRLGIDVTIITDPPAVQSTKAVEVHTSSDRQAILTTVFDTLVSAIEEFEHRGSG